MIELKNINLSYHKTLIQEGSITLPDDSITAIIGKSGLGKTTLLNQIGFIDENWDQHCEYYLDGKRLNKKEALQQYRLQYFYLFQNNNLIDEMTCFDNILFLASTKGIKVTKSEILEIFEALNLDIDLTQKPTQVSGGQRQKLEIAMLAILKPRIILCDEITSALDAISARETFDLLKKIVKEIHATCVLILHDPTLIEVSDAIYAIENERLVCKKEAKNTNQSTSVVNHFHPKAYIDYLILKLHNRSFLIKSLVTGMLFVFMITSFNLIDRYHNDSQANIQNTILGAKNQEFIFDYHEGFDFDVLPYYQYKVETNHGEATLHINASHQEVEKNLQLRLLPQGIYINLSYADQLGIKTNSTQYTLDIDGITYRIAGIVKDEYYQGNSGNSIYVLDNQPIIEPREEAKYMMHYVDKLENLPLIEKQIKDQKLNIYSSIKDYTDMVENNHKIEYFMNILLWAVIIIMIAFSLIYSIIQFEDKLKEITLLYRRGFRLGGLSLLNISENLVILGLMIVVSPILTNIISKSFERNGIFNISTQSMILHYLIVSTIIGMIMIGLSQFMISFIYIRRKK